MFTGASLLVTAELIALSNYLNEVLPPAESDPVGIFDRPIKDCYDYIVAIRQSRKLEKKKAWRSIGAKLVRHDVKGHCSELRFNSERYWKCMVRHFGHIGSHLGGTCRLGNKHDPTTVVDPYLRVKGIKNLRVADASVIRNLPSGLINTPVTTIAEKVSDMIKQSRHHQTKYSHNKIVY